MRGMRLIIALLLLFATHGWSQDEAKASLKINPAQIQTNETFEIIVEANVNGTVDISFPNEFQILNRTKQMHSSGGNMTVIINGRPVNQGKTETNYIYKYIARVSKKGTYQIKDASYKYAGGSINLNNLTVKITDAPPVSNSVKNNIGKPFFGIISTSRNQVYVGEPVVISSKVYSRGRITDVADYEPLKIEGLAHKTDLFKNLDNLQVKNESIEGVNFQTIKISEDVVIPQEAGSITCVPFSIQLGYQGNFFFNDYTRIESGSASIKVLPLPDGAPKGFNGAVGNFKVSASIEGSDLKEGDVFIYKLRMEGKGNLHLLSTPEINLPEAFEQYGDPRKNEKVSIGAQGGEGFIEFEYTIQANEGGRYNWQPLSFGYFNPSQKKYITVELANVQLDIAKSEFEAMADGSLKRDVTIKATGLRFLALEPHPRAYNFLIDKFYFWLLFLGLPIIGVATGYYARNRRQNKDSIHADGMSKKASKMAQKEVELAQSLWQKGAYKAFAEEGLRAMNSFLSRKMKCPTSELNHSKIKEALDNAKIDVETANAWLDLMGKLEFLKYTSFGPDYNDNLPAIIRDLIIKIDASWK